MKTKRALFESSLSLRHNFLVNARAVLGISLNWRTLEHGKVQFAELDPELKVKATTQYQNELSCIRV